MKKFLFSLLAVAAFSAPSSALAGPVIIKVEGDASAQKVIVDARPQAATESGGGTFFFLTRYNETPSSTDGDEIAKQGIQIQGLNLTEESVAVDGGCYSTTVSIYQGANQGGYRDTLVWRCPLADDVTDTTDDLSKQPVGDVYPQRPLQPWETTSLVFLGSENNDSVYNMTGAAYARATSGKNAGRLMNSYGAGDYTYSDGWNPPQPVLGIPLEARGYKGHDYISDASGASSLFGGPGTDTIYGSSTGSEVDDFNRNRGSSQTKLPPVAGDVISGGTGSGIAGALDLLEGGEGDDTFFVGSEASHVLARRGADTIYDGAGNDFIDLSKEGRARFADEVVTPDNAADSIYCEQGNNTYYGSDLGETDTRQTDLCEDEPADTWAASVPPVVVVPPVDPPVVDPPAENPPVVTPPVVVPPVVVPPTTPIGPPVSIAPPVVPPIEAPKPIVVPPVVEGPVAPGKQEKFASKSISIAFTDKGKLSSASVTKLKKAAKALKATSTKERLVTLYIKGDRSKADAEKAFKEVKKVTGASFKLKITKGTKSSVVTYSQRTA